MSLNSREAGIAGNRKEPVSASVAMVHNIPELIISEKVLSRIVKTSSFFKAIAKMSTQDYSVFLLMWCLVHFMSNWDMFILASLGTRENGWGKTVKD